MGWRCSLAWRAWEQSRSSVPHSERVAFRGLAGSEGLVGSDVLAGSAALAADSVGCGARNAAGLASSAVSALGRVLNSLVRGAIPPINAAAGRYGTSSTTSVNTETRMRAVASRGVVPVGKQRRYAISNLRCKTGNKAAEMARIRRFTRLLRVELYNLG